MKKQFSLTILLVLLTVSALSVQLSLVYAQSSGVGVQKGNSFEYTVSLSGSDAASSRANGVTNVTATVSSLTGTLVSYSLEAQFQNGTQRNVTASVDVSNGQSENTANVVIPWDLVAANLGIDDPTYPNSSSWANETVNVNGRPTDHSFQTSLEQGGAENVTLDTYWDEATGVPVNVTEIDTVTGQGVELNMSYALVATNAWTILPEFSPQGTLIITMMLGGIAAALSLRRKKMPLPEQAALVNTAT